MASPLILDIRGNSLEDGPGIRSVVFFKGCPLDCVWCHNPESKKPGVEISHDAGQCIGCGTCIQTCPAGALSPTFPGFVDRSQCTLCFACEPVCPSGALSRVGRAMTQDQIVAAVVRNKPFFDTSGGGVTLSGGEPTLHSAFASGLMQAFRAAGVSTLVETCGCFDFSRFMDRIYPWADLIYYDIKLISPEAHQRYCGADNRIILDNFVRLHQMAKEGGVPILPRTPLVPGITDTPDNLAALAGFYRQHGVTRAALLSYNPLWPDKLRKLGQNSPLEKEAAALAWIPGHKEAACRHILTRAGIHLEE